MALLHRALWSVQGFPGRGRCEPPRPPLDALAEREATPTEGGHFAPRERDLYRVGYTVAYSNSPLRLLAGSSAPNIRWKGRYGASVAAGNKMIAVVRKL